MKDPWNPHQQEIRDWAFNEEACWPSQDFDLAVAEVWFGDLILELANDESCPRKKFFLSCAYIVVGDAVMTEYSSRTKDEVKVFLDKVAEIKNDEMALLYSRSIELLRDPSSFDYDLWCGEGYVNQNS